MNDTEDRPGFLTRRAFAAGATAAAGLGGAAPLRAAPWRAAAHADPARPSPPFEVWSGPPPGPERIIRVDSMEGLKQAFAAARGAPGARTVALVTVDALPGGWSEFRGADFVAAGGGFTVRPEGPGHVRWSGGLYLQGCSGVCFERLHFDRRVDAYLDIRTADATTNATVWLKAGPEGPTRAAFRDCRFGVDWDGGDALSSPGALRIMEDATARLERCDFRGVSTAMQINGGCAVHVLDTLFMQFWQDCMYLRQGGDTRRPRIRLWAANCVVAAPHDPPLQLMLVPRGLFIEGEALTQNAAPLGRVARIVRATDPGAFTSGWGRPHGGDVVYVSVERSILPGAPVRGAVSGDGYAPENVDSYWMGWDAGPPLAMMHSDFIQFGSPRDADDTVYEVHAENNVVVCGTLHQNVTQGVFGANNLRSGAAARPNALYFANNHFGVTGGWGLAAVSPRMVVRNLNLFTPPLGVRVPVAAAAGRGAEVGPQPNYDAEDEPMLVFGPLAAGQRDFNETTVIEHVIAAGVQQSPKLSFWLRHMPVRRFVHSFTRALPTRRPADPLSYARVYGVDPALYDGKQVVEPPIADLGATASRADAMARVRRWVSENRRPPAGWGADGWIDPVRFADAGRD